MSDERIRAAAAELAAALTEGGKDYSVWVQGIEVTCIDSEAREFAWVVEVDERETRRIAP